MRDVKLVFGTMTIGEQLFEKEAEEIMQRTTRKCEQLYSVTKENVDKLLRSVEIYLEQNLAVVKRNRDELETAINNIKSVDLDNDD
jgi:hypothetical protein